MFNNAGAEDESGEFLWKAKLEANELLALKKKISRKNCKEAILNEKVYINC